MHRSGSNGCQGISTGERLQRAFNGTALGSPDTRLGGEAASVLIQDFVK